MTLQPDSFNVVAQISALRAYAHTLTRNRQDAEDLVQETMTLAYEQRNALRAPGQLRGWLLSILHNVFSTNWRRQKRHHDMHAQQDPFDEPQVASNQEATVRLAQIHQAFLQLPDDQRAALHLVSVEGLSYREAATALGVPTGTLMSRLGRARAALRAFEDAGASATPSASAAPVKRVQRLKVVGGSDAI
jgi:RNA polymerase sigma-70 factor (ECF subfamily)